MGDFADAVIDGTMCQGCGMYIGSACGYPRDCRDCKREEKPKKQPVKNITAQPIGDKQRALLEAAMRHTDEISGMYPGIYIEQAPAQIRKLINRGFLEEYRPHNPVHKLRAVITDAGREALSNGGDSNAK